MPATKPIGLRVGVMLLAALAGALTAAPASAQETRSSVLGTVTDPSGAVLPGVTVEVVNTRTNQRTALVTNASGYFEATYLLPGSYVVTFSLDGFKSVRRSGLELSTNVRLRVDITLEIGTQTEVVQVVGESPMLETSTASGSTTLSEKQVMELPFGPGRRFLQEGWLAPIVRDWQISGIYYYRTGSAISFDNVSWYGDAPANPLDPNDPVYRAIAEPSAGRRPEAIKHVAFDAAWVREPPPR